MHKTGRVKWFDTRKGFGFLIPDEGGAEPFVHHSDIELPRGERDLIEGEAVEFDLVQGEKGPKAVRVKPYTPLPYREVA